jgi:hypothetical protein
MAVLAFLPALLRLSMPCWTSLLASSLRDLAVVFMVNFHGGNEQWPTAISV